MGLLAKIDSTIRAASYKDTEGWFADWLRDDSDSRNDAGVTVNERNAMQISTVWKCVTWRAKMFGSLPKKLYERVTVEGRPSQQDAVNHPIYDLIHASPNPTMTAYSYFALISADLHLWGNNYSYIERYPNSMRIRYLWRIPPDRVRIWYDLEAQNPEDAITYMVRGADGYETPYFRDEILHVSGLGYDGICGYSPIRLQMLALGWNKAAVKYGANFFKNSSRPSFLAFAKGVVKKEAKADIIKNLTMAGRKAGEGLLIEGDMDIKQLTMPQDEAQFIETMQYQEEDIAGIMEVKPHEIGIMRHMTNNNVEQETISSVTRCLAPFAVNVEQWFNLQLLSDMRSSGLGGGTERQRYFMECELKGLLRGDTAAQTAHIEKMIDRGVYSQNDACAYLGEPGFSGGDRHYINSAYIPLDKIDEFLMKRSSTAGSTSTNNNPPSGDQQQTDQRNKILTPIFRDAVGRVIARKKDREKATVSIFRNLMAAVGHKGEEFLTEYLNAMGQRSLDWSDIDAVASAELSRAIHAFSEAQ